MYIPPLIAITLRIKIVFCDIQYFILSYSLNYYTQLATTSQLKSLKFLILHAMITSEEFYICFRIEIGGRYGLR